MYLNLVACIHGYITMHGFMNVKLRSNHNNQTREEQRLEAAQMKFLRHLLGITKLDKEKKNQSIGGKNRSTEYSKGNKTVP